MKSMTRNGLRQNIPKNSKGCLIQVSLIYFALLDILFKRKMKSVTDLKKSFDNG